MQTFLPYDSFIESAVVLDYKRLKKQVVEVKQILIALVGDWGCVGTKKNPHDAYTNRWEDKRCVVCNRLKGHRHHPAVLMWEGHEYALADYGLVMYGHFLDLYKERNSAIDYIMDMSKALINEGVDTSLPSWFGDHAFHASHRSNLLRKDPQHYGQFDWSEPDNLPYVWPVTIAQLEAVK